MIFTTLMQEILVYTLLAPSFNHKCSKAHLEFVAISGPFLKTFEHR